MPREKYHTKSDKLWRKEGDQETDFKWVLWVIKQYFFKKQKPCLNSVPLEFLMNDI